MGLFVYSKASVLTGWQHSLVISKALWLRIFGKLVFSTLHSIAVTKHGDQDQLGDDRVCLAFYYSSKSQSIIWEVMAGNEAGSETQES